MFAEDSTVLYFSMHRYDNSRFFPGGNLGHYTSHGEGAGAGFSVNVPWNVSEGECCGFAAPGDAECLDAWRRVLMPIATEFAPDLVLVSAGFDSALGDPLGGCRLSPGGYYELTRQLMQVAGGRMVIALEGGYNLESISVSMAACMRALLGDINPSQLQGRTEPEPWHAKTVTEVRFHLKQFWTSLQEELEPISYSSEVPETALNGSLLAMQLALREHAEAVGGDYAELRKRQEHLLFKMDEMPSVDESSSRRRMSALVQGFGDKVAGRPFLVPVLQVTVPEQAVSNAKLAFDAGAHGVLFTSSGSAETADDKKARSKQMRECFAAVRELYPDLWLGVSAPWLSSVQAFGWVARDCQTADALWLREFPCRPAEVEWEVGQALAVRNLRWLTLQEQPELASIRQARSKSGWLGLVLGTIADPTDKVHHGQESGDTNNICDMLLAHWASLAASSCDVVVTCGDEAACAAKLHAMRRSRPLGCQRTCSGALGDQLADVTASDLVLEAGCVYTQLPDGSSDSTQFDDVRLRHWVDKCRAAAASS